MLWRFRSCSSIVVLMVVIIVTLGSVYFDVKWFLKNDFHILRYLLRRKIVVNGKYFPFDQKFFFNFQKMVYNYENRKPFSDSEHLTLKSTDLVKTCPRPHHLPKTHPGLDRDLPKTHSGPRQDLLETWVGIKLSPLETAPSPLFFYVFFFLCLPNEEEGFFPLPSLFLYFSSSSFFFPLIALSKT
jgi:hypothetical protein